MIEWAPRWCNYEPVSVGVCYRTLWCQYYVRFWAIYKEDRARSLRSLIRNNTTTLYPYICTSPVQPNIFLPPIVASAYWRWVIPCFNKMMLITSIMVFPWSTISMAARRTSLLERTLSATVGTSTRNRPCLSMSSSCQTSTTHQAIRTHS